MMIKSLIAYFSVSGNTEKVAKIIKEETNGDIFKIETLKSYPRDHRKVIQVGKKEWLEDLRPPLKGKVENFSKYSIVYLAYPIWFGTIPMAVATFLESYDFNNKIIKPICTHGGSKLKNNENAIKILINNGILKEGIPIFHNEIESSKKEIINWINK